MLSTMPSDLSANGARQYPALGDMLDPQNQLAKLEGLDVIKEPISFIENVPYIYQSALDYVQVSSGIPWWGILIGAGFTMRMATLPFHIQFEKGVMQRLPSMKLEKEAILAKISGDLVLSVRKLKNSLSLKKSGGLQNTIWLIKYFVPGTMLMTLNYYTIYGLTAMHYTPILQSNFFWIPSLCLADPERVLSFVNGIMIAAIIRRFILNTPDSQKSAWITSHKKAWALIGFSAIVAQAALPSSILLYWTSSNATRYFLIDRLLQTDWFRKSVGLVSYGEKVSAYEAIPKTLATSAIKLVEGNVVGGNYIVDANTVLVKDLTQLLKDGDFETHKIKTDELKNEIHVSCEKLAGDLEFCEQKLKSPLTSIYQHIPSTLSSQYIKQQEIIKSKLDDSKGQLIRLEFTDRKRELAKIKKKLEMSRDCLSGSEVQKHQEELRLTHSELLSQLEECEMKLSETSSTKNMQYFELFVKKQELLNHQKNILRDIEICEDEILSENLTKAKEMT